MFMQHRALVYYLLDFLPVGQACSETQQEANAMQLIDSTSEKDNKEPTYSLTLWCHIICQQSSRSNLTNSNLRAISITSAFKLCLGHVEDKVRAASHAIGTWPPSTWIPTQIDTSGLNARSTFLMEYLEKLDLWLMVHGSRFSQWGFQFIVFAESTGH